MPTKVKILKWRAILDKLPTKVNLVRKGVDLENDRCSLCIEEPETVTHLFVDFKITSEACSQLVVENYVDK